LQGERPSEESSADFIAPTANVSPARTAVACLAALAFPGLGHFVLGRWGRGLTIALSLVAMFALGFAMKGHLFTPVPGEWITYAFSFLDMGIGLPYFACLAADFGFKLEQLQPAVPTFEYGNTFLLVTGALNLLVTMDAYDIAVGRKR